MEDGPCLGRLPRGILRDEVAAALSHAGFTNVRWLFPSNSGFYQPIVIAEVV
jgi:hypothetical protein